MVDSQREARERNAAFDVGSLRVQLLSLQRSVEAHASLDGARGGSADEGIWNPSSWFAPFIANLPCLAIIKEPAGRYLYVNALWERHFSRSSAQWYGKTDADLWPAEVAASILANDRECAETGKGVQTVERIPRGDLDSYWLVSRFPLGQQHGPSGLIGCLALEITDRVHAETVLRDSEKRYRELVETMLYGVYRIAPDGRLLMVNQALVECLGYESAEAVYEAGARGLLRPAGEAQRIMKGIHEHGPTQIATGWIRQDGSELQVQESVNAVRRANGSIVFLEGVVKQTLETGVVELLEKDRNHLLEMSLQDAPLDAIQAEACRIAERYSAGARAVLFGVESGSLTLAAAPGLTPGFARNLGAVLGTAGELNAAILAGETVVRPDLRKPSEADPHSAVAVSHGMRACWSVPVWSGTLGLAGCLCLYSPRARRPNAAELELLTKISRLSALAIDCQRMRDNLIQEARYDQLTGLPNRWTIEYRLEQSLIRCARTEGRCALLWIDLDRFKGINDTLGHRFGDDILIQAASRLNRCVPGEAMVARIGGDEFAVLLPRISSPEEAERYALAICDEFRKPFQTQGYSFFVTASVGIAAFPEDAHSAAEMERDADLAMYSAKNHGRNGFRRYDEHLSSGSRVRLEVEQSLPHALPHSEFELYYQAQVDMDGRLRAMEALLRWNHPKLGLLIPRDFVRIAEDTGMIVPVGAWVLREACRQAAEWECTCPAPVRVAVNVSALQLYHADFVQVVQEALRQSGLTPGLLELELTETVVMCNFEEASRQMQAIRSLGVSIAIDDFGTGYSSLSYLHELPADTLKIDRSFLERLESAHTLPVLRAVTSLAHSLGLSVVAEGVEHERQFQTVQSVGVDLVQGFLFGYPETASRAAEKVASLSLDQVPDRN